MRFLYIAAALGSAAFLVSQPGPERMQPGPDAAGGYMLVTGWRIQPAGKQIPLDTFPMSSALSKDGRHLLILNAGYNPPSISVLRTDTMQELGRTTLVDGWLGLAFSPDGKFVYVGGGSQASVYEFTFNDGKLEPARTFEIVAEKTRTPRDFIGDVALSPDGRLIYAAGLFNDAIHVINPQSGRVIEKFTTGRRPYRILFHPDGKSYLVSSWADGAVYHHNAATGERLGLIRLGQHPTDMIWRPRKAEEDDEQHKLWPLRLIVAAANTNNVYVAGMSESKDMRLIESINVAMRSRQPLGMTPSALALNSDQTRLYVACSDANAVAVADISDMKSVVLGFIPTGWYPTAIRTLGDDRIIVVNGRGAGNGTASVIDPPDDEQLEKYTQTVVRNSPYREEFLDRVPIEAGNPVPSRPGDPSSIQHVLYIVKANRTYDQVLGDLGKGNGDPKRAVFGENVSPNHHKLAREFVLFDNFYVNGDAGPDGHNWSISAIAPDYVQKMWPNSEANRRRHYDYEGGEPAAIPPAGYIWTNAASAGISMRNYGWWVNNAPASSDSASPQVASVRDSLLAKVSNRSFRGPDLDYPDVKRADVFIQDLREFEKTGQMPKLMFLRLGSGDTPAAMADNDAALGMIVEALSKSKFWPATAIFVLEGHTRNGPDHVDSHRAPAYVLSPYTRRGIIDSTMYNTASMLRTIELIVGLRPMTHFDAAARPMSAAFASKPDLRPYEAEKPRIPLSR